MNNPAPVRRMRRLLSSGLNGSVLAVIILVLFWKGNVIAIEESRPTATAKDTETIRPELVLQVGHHGIVADLSFSPDGKMLVSGGAAGDHSVKLWSVRTGELLRSLEGPDGDLRSVQFSPDGRFIAGDMMVWETRTGRLMQKLNLNGPAVGFAGAEIAFLPDSLLLATISKDGVQRWDMAGGKPLPPKPENREERGIDDTPQTAFGRADSFAVDLAGSFRKTSHRTLLSARYGNSFSLIDVETGTALWQRTEAEYSSCADVSPNQRTMASGLGEQFDATGDIRLWDGPTGETLWRVTGHPGAIDAIVFSPDGATVASGSKDKTVKIWEVRTGKLLRTLEDHHEGVRSVAFSPDGKLLAGGGEHQILIWDVRTGKLKRRLGGVAAGTSVPVIRALTFMPGSPAGDATGYQLRFASDEGTIAAWDFATGTVKALTRIPGEVGPATFSHDGKTLLFRLLSGDYGGQLLDLSTRQIFPVLKESVRASEVALAPDGRTVAVGGRDHVIRIMDGLAGTLHYELRGHKETISHLFFSRDGRLLTSVSHDGVLNIWNLDDRTLQATVKDSLMGTINDAFAFSPDGGSVTTPSINALFQLRNALTGESQRTVSVGFHAGNIVFSPGGEMMAASGDDDAVRLIDATTGDIISTVKTSGRLIMAMDFTPDGKMLAIGHANGIIDVCSVSSGQVMATLRILSSSPSDKNPLEWIVLTPDGSYAASKGAERFIRWRVGERLLPARKYRKRFQRSMLF